MSVFSGVEARKPPGLVVVPPSAFADAWEERPSDDVAIGLRLVPVADLQAARAQAAEKANDAHPDVDLIDGDPFNAQLWIDAYEEWLMIWIVARGICDPNDVSEPWEPFKAAPEDMARDYLTADGAKLIFDAWERMRIVSDPTRKEATDDEVKELVGYLDTRLPRALSARRARVRRLLAFCLDELRAVAPVEPPPVTAP